MESEQPKMDDEPPYPALDRLTEEVAEAIIFTISGTPGDPKPAVVRLLRQYLADVREQEYAEALREQQLEEHDQQN